MAIFNLLTFDDSPGTLIFTTQPSPVCSMAGEAVICAASSALRAAASGEKWKEAG